jgi:hypothetical protein
MKIMNNANEWREIMSIIIMKINENEIMIE